MLLLNECSIVTRLGPPVFCAIKPESAWSRMNACKADEADAGTGEVIKCLRLSDGISLARSLEGRKILNLDLGKLWQAWLCERKSFAISPKSRHVS